MSLLDSGQNSPEDITVEYDTQPPSITNFIATPPFVKIGESVTISATVDDSNTGGSNIMSPVEYQIEGTGNWVAMNAVDGAFDDEPKEEVTYTFPSGFPTADVKNIQIRATDGAGNTVYELLPLPVYDPTAGFVTGGGFYNSPAGAVLNSPAPPDEKGKVVFGFASRYNRGYLKGETNFVFHSKTIPLAIFHSENYLYLVVTGNKARYEGTGTINGKGSYGFVLSTIDGDVTGGNGKDYLRLRIWDKMNNNDPVYDNQPLAGDTADPTMPIGFGNIKVHKS
jgi:hypothetical protein